MYSNYIMRTYVRKEDNKKDILLLVECQKVIKKHIFTKISWGEILVYEYWGEIFVENIYLFILPKFFLQLNIKNKLSAQSK